MATVAKQQLTTLLPCYIRRFLHQLSFWKKNIEAAFVKGFGEADAFCVSEANKDGYMNGCTAVIALILDGVLHIANLGDSEAILISEADTVDNLTVPHKANVASEKQRIEQLGGHVFFNRVFGTLAVSRAFGDSKYKQPKTSQNFVSCVPAIKQIQLTPQHQYLVLACDGLWDVCNHDEVAAMVRLQHQSNKTPKEIASFLVTEALRKRSEDNVTVTVTKIDWKGTAASTENSSAPATKDSDAAPVAKDSDVPAKDSDATPAKTDS
jgi:serine/threonine protein phosphatase PrpC